MKLLYFIFLVVLSQLFTSCVTQQHAMSAYDGKIAGGVYIEQSADFEDREEGLQPSTKKIIYSSDLYLTVDNPDSVLKQLNVIATTFNGYVQQTGTTKCVLRIPNASRNAATGEIEKCGKVTYKNTTGEDVSDQYADYGIRLDNAKTARKRYLELLEKAQTVAEALLVEKELERLNETIDLLEGKMNRIDHLSTYSTITIYLKEKKKPGIIGYIGIGIYHSVKWLFVRN